MHQGARRLSAGTRKRHHCPQLRDGHAGLWAAAIRSSDAPAALSHDDAVREVLKHAGACGRTDASTCVRAHTASAEAGDLSCAACWNRGERTLGPLLRAQLEERVAPARGGRISPPDGCKPRAKIVCAHPGMRKEPTVVGKLLAWQMRTMSRSCTSEL